jgi:LmbE family N-acetylglucosaminyl deacetylase
MGMRIAAIATHPDDETLGCGGTLLRRQAEGAEIHWIIVTPLHEPRWRARDMEIWQSQIDNVAAAYDFAGIHRLGFPSAALDTVPLDHMTVALGAAIEDIRPDVVMLNHRGDVHTDHRIAFDAALSMLKPIHMAHFGVKRILAYETLSSTEAASPPAGDIFVPNHFVEIGDAIDRKVEIMALYQSEVQADPLPRGPSALRALARYRGASIGKDHAEAFMLIRDLDTLAS